MNTKELDLHLVMRAQAGERRAFDLLVKKYYRKALALVSRVVRDGNLVEDIVQDALMRAYCALPSFRREASFYTWLYRIILNTAKNHLLNQKRYASSLVSTALEEDMHHVEYRSQDMETPEGVLQSKQVAYVLNQAVLSLSEEMRGAILLREIDGLSYGQIALQMQCPVGTVRSRIFRAREVIAERLQPILDRKFNKSFQNVVKMAQM